MIVNTKKHFLLFGIFLIAVGLLTTVIKADSEKDLKMVTTTVSIQGVSFWVDYGQNHATYNDPIITAIDYGTMSFSGSRTSNEIHSWYENETDIHKNIRVTVENGHNIKLQIKGENSEDWTIDGEEIGVNKYMHAFGAIPDLDSTPGTTEAITAQFLTNDYKDLHSGLNDSSMWFGLKIYVPQSGKINSQSVPVTVLAELVSED